MEIIRLDLVELQKRAMAKKLRGVYFVTNEDYHDGPGWSSSQLKLALRSPMHALVKRPMTEALACGQALHDAVLSPEVFAIGYVTEPTWVHRANTPEGRRERDIWRECLGEINYGSERKSINAAEGRMIESVVRSLAESKTYRRIVTGAQHELAAYWTDEQTQLLCKAKADIWNGATVADIKSTQDASPASFAKAIVRYDYHLSAALYVDGFTQALRFPVSSFVFIAIEKMLPYGCAFYELDADGLAAGRRAYRTALANIADAMTMPNRACYPDEIRAINLPGYVKNKYED